MITCWYFNCCQVFAQHQDLLWVSLCPHSELRGWQWVGRAHSQADVSKEIFHATYIMHGNERGRRILGRLATVYSRTCWPLVHLWEWCLSMYCNLYCFFCSSFKLLSHSLNIFILSPSIFLFSTVPFGFALPIRVYGQVSGCVVLSCLLVLVHRWENSATTNQNAFCMGAHKKEDKTSFLLKLWIGQLVYLQENNA